MADPWGPGVKRDVESVDSYIKSFNALGAEKFKISAIRDRRGPIFMQEQLHYIVQAMDGDGNLHFMVNASGEITEASAATISAAIAVIKNDLADVKGLFNMKYSADGVGVDTSGVAWDPIPSVVGAGTVITADGAGNIGAAADVIAAPAGAAKLDGWMICQVTITGEYTTKWCEDPTGTPAVGSPDYHTAGHIAYMVAGYPYILREMCPTDTVGLGYDAGVNGNWPNDAVMYITGYSREI